MNESNYALLRFHSTTLLDSIAQSYHKDSSDS